MNLRLSAALALVVWLFAAAAGRLQAEPGFFLKEMPDREVAIPETPATADEAKKIKKLIQELAATDAPDIGYCASTSGYAFSPLPDLNQRAMERMMDHGLEHSATLKRLVAFGPKALPFLLDALDDKTPTKLILHPVEYHKAHALGLTVGTSMVLVNLDTFGSGCCIVPAREILYNPLNAAEARALKTADVVLMTSVGRVLGNRKGKLPTAHIKDEGEYSVTVGDLCLVAMGQITNRPYQAARYQMTGYTFINSPSHDPEIAKAVRSVWATKTYRRQLFDSLLIDFHTRGGDHRGGTEGLQLGAATRLLYYFPDQAGPVVAQRLRDLNVGSEIDLDKRQGFEANGIWADELLQAVAFSENPDARRELLDVFRRTAHQGVALAALPAIDKERRAEVLPKLELFIKALPKEEDGLYGDGYKLLEAVGKHLPNDRYALYQKYLAKAGAQRRTTVCRVLREEWAKELAQELLPRWLEDKRAAFQPKSDLNGVFLGLSGKRRICDEAAPTLVCHVEGITFDPKAKQEDRDKQIAAIRKKLSER
jgi:hypothetical protein